jgi:hypothetical protein
MLVSILISRNHSITRLISFAKNGSNQRSIVSVYGPIQNMRVKKRAFRGRGRWKRLIRREAVAFIMTTVHYTMKYTFGTGTVLVCSSLFCKMRFPVTTSMIFIVFLINTSVDTPKSETNPPPPPPPIPYHLRRLRGSRRQAVCDYTFTYLPCSPRILTEREPCTCSFSAVTPTCSLPWPAS